MGIKTGSQKKVKRVPAEAERSAYHVEAIERALSIQALFSSRQPVLSLVEIGREIGAVPSTTLRIVNTLEDLEFLESVGDKGAYRAGRAALQLGHNFIAGSRLRTVASPTLSRLMQEAGEGVSLSILSGQFIYMLEHCRSSGPMAVDLPHGAKLPAHVTAAGKAMLAHLPEARLKEVLASMDFEQTGPQTLTSKDAIRRDLDQARRAGFAVQDQELAGGTRSIAAAILDSSDLPLGAVSITVATGRFEVSELVRIFSPLVVGGAAEISARMRSEFVPAEVDTQPVDSVQAAEGEEDSGGETRSRYHVEAVARGLQSLLTFEASHPRMTLSVIARRIDALLPTAYRVMATLVGLGYADFEDSTGLYSLSPKVLDLGYEGLCWLSLADLLQPPLQRFHEETGLSVYLSVVSGHAALDIVSLRKPGALSTLGRSYPLYCTPGGKILLAYMEPDERTTLLSGVELIRHGPKTLTDPQALLNELATIRTEGLAVAEDEYLPGSRGLAVPVFDSNGSCIATIAFAVHGLEKFPAKEWVALRRRAQALGADASARLAARFS